VLWTKLRAVAQHCKTMWRPDGDPAGDRETVWRRPCAASATGVRRPVPPQNPVDRTIVDISALGVKLACPDASLAVRPARDRQIEPEAAARTRSADPRLV